MENTEKINEVLLDDMKMEISISNSLSTPTPCPHSEMISVLEKKFESYAESMSFLIKPPKKNLVKTKPAMVIITVFIKDLIILLIPMSLWNKIVKKTNVKSSL